MIKKTSSNQSHLIVVITWLFVLAALFSVKSVLGQCTPTNINSLPYIADGSTCASTTSYQGNGCLTGPGFAGNYLTYTYTPTSDECVRIFLFPPSDPFTRTPQNLGIAVFDGCPNIGGICIASDIANSTIVGTPTPIIESLNLSGGNTYYIVVPTGTGMFNYSCLTFNLTILPCPIPFTLPDNISDCGNNISFEDGDLNGWIGSTDAGTPLDANGNIKVPGTPGIVTGGLNAGVTGCFPGSRHTLVSGTIDPNSDGNIPLPFPGLGTTAVKIGNQSPGGEYECLEKTFLVTPDNVLFTYLYAVVYQDVGHDLLDQPKFEIELTDANGDRIDCGGFYEVTAGDDNAVNGFLNATNPACGGDDVYYKPWTAVGTNLSNYIGQNLTIKFCTADCSQSAHFGYAYVDTYCTELEIDGIVLCSLAGGDVNFSGPQGFQNYVWRQGDSNGPDIGTGIDLTVSNPQAGDIYTVVFEDITGSGCQFFITDTVEISDPQIRPDTTVCNNELGNIALTISGEIAPGSTFNWTSTPAGFTSTDQSPIIAFPTVTTTYDVVITSPNCPITNQSITITVESCGINITLLGDTICEGDGPGNLIAVATDGDGDYTLTWSGGGLTGQTDNPPIGSPQTVTRTDNPTTTTTYQVFVVDGSGNRDTATADIVINPLPTVITATNATICIEDSAEITASGADTYVWDNGLPASAGPHTVSPTVTTTYTVTGTDVNGCVNDSSVTITVNPLPIITTADDAVCKGLPIIITANGGLTYTWVSLDGGLINSGANTATPELSTDQPGATTNIIRRYEVRGTDGNGCINKDTATITFTSICGFKVIAIGDTICVNEPMAQLNSDTSLVAGGITYSWTPITGLNDPTIANPTVTGLINTTTYQLIATDNNGSDTATTTIYVNPSPIVSADSDASICIGETADISASGADSYTWDNGLPSTSGVHTVSPTVTTTYTVTGTDVNRCTNTDTVRITVNELPVPDAGLDQVICEGETATITSNSTGLAPITYTWDQTPPGTGSGPHNLTPTVTSTYDLTVRDANGCEGSTSVTITVNPLPTVSMSDDLEICEGETAMISASGGITYVWDQTPPGTGSGPHPVVPLTTTTYNVTVTDANTCINTGSVTVTVNPLPIVNAGNDQTICAGANGTIQATAQGTGPFIFTWGQTPPGTGAGPHILSPNATTSYLLTVTDAKGCINKDTIIINVNPIPTIGAGQDETICIGQTVSLTGSGGATYEWKNVTTGALISTDQTVTVQPTVNTCYEVTGTDAIGCSSADVVCVNLAQLPLPSFDAAELCEGESTLFNNTSTGGLVYTWDFGDGTTSSAFSPQHIYNGSGVYQVQLLVTSSAGCKDSVTNPIQVNYVPTPLFEGDTLQGCPEFTTNFINQTDSLDPNFTYLWDFGAGVSTSSDSVVSLLYRNPGTYTVSLTVTTDKGCSSTFTRNNYVTVYQEPIADFEATPPITDIFHPVIDFTDLSIGADVWQWDFGDTGSSADQNPSHEYQDTGTYIVWLRVSNIYGCTDSIEKVVVIKDVYTFYAPNAFTPDADGTNDVFLPQGNAIDIAEYELTIFDRWGELIYKTEDIQEGWDGTLNGVPVQIDTYIWKVNLKDIYGVNHKYVGRVSIVK